VPLNNATEDLLTIGGARYRVRAPRVYRTPPATWSPGKSSGCDPAERP